MGQLYGEYEAALRASNSLDFDDLLVFGLRLFRTAPRVISHCKHILVDEFQVSDKWSMRSEMGCKCLYQTSGHEHNPV